MDTLVTVTVLPLPVATAEKNVDQDHRETIGPLKVRLLNPTLSVHDANPLEPMEAEQHGSQGRQNLWLSCSRR